MSGAWNTVLENYSRLKDPQKELGSDVYLLSNDQALTIFDGYEKAKYHFLVLPRDPFLLSSSTTSTTSSPRQVPSSHLASLSTLRKSPHALEVLRALEKQAHEVKAMIEDEMVKSEGWKWGVQIGFHASESMKQVHLHVISSDLISPKLKNKKHYNSFHPKLGFFLHLEDVLEQVEAGVVDTRSAFSYEQIWKEPLQSIYTGEEMKNLPKLKEHLESEWSKMGRKAKETRAREDKTRLKRELEEQGKEGSESKKHKEATSS